MLSRRCPSASETADTEFEFALRALSPVIRVAPTMLFEVDVVFVHAAGANSIDAIKSLQANL